MPLGNRISKAEWLLEPLPVPSSLVHIAEGFPYALMIAALHRRDLESGTVIDIRLDLPNIRAPRS